MEGALDVDGDFMEHQVWMERSLSRQVWIEIHGAPGMDEVQHFMQHQVLANSLRRARSGRTLHVGRTHSMGHQVWGTWFSARSGRAVHMAPHTDGALDVGPRSDLRSLETSGGGWRRREGPGDIWNRLETCRQA